MTRTPAVAGMFYEADRASLIRSLERRFAGPLGPGKLPQAAEQGPGRILGLVCPHAGYLYSGPAAAHAYAALAADGVPDTAVLLGPNHYGAGAAVAVSGADEWSTPLGALSVDAEAREVILRLSKYAQSDDRAHLREHSIEVQLPFLQLIGGDDVKIVPISIAHLGEHEAPAVARDVGAAISGALEGRRAVVIASTDFTHYEPQAAAYEKDSQAIDRIAAMDTAGLLATVYGRGITMCGVVGTCVMLEACRAMGATRARKLAYHTSGDVTGDTREVVGYGAVSVER